MRPLSPRMEEVVELVVGQGLLYKQAAETMGIAEQSVKNYAGEIGRRVGKRPPRAMVWYYYNVLRAA